MIRLVRKLCLKMFKQCIFFNSRYSKQKTFHNYHSLDYTERIRLPVCKNFNFSFIVFWAIDLIKNLDECVKSVLYLLIPPQKLVSPLPWYFSFASEFKIKFAHPTRYKLMTSYHIAIKTFNNWNVNIATAFMKPTYKGQTQLGSSGACEQGTPGAK